MKGWYERPEEERVRIAWVVVIVVVLILAGIGNSAGQGSGPKPPSPCLVAWANSVEKDVGASRSNYLERCEAGLDDLEDAVE